MTEAIIVAIIAACATLLGNLIISRKSTAETFARLDKQSELSDARLEKSQAVTDEKIEELTREVRAHNEFARRVPILETKVEILEKKVGV